jgi:hypothetical protein
MALINYTYTLLLPFIVFSSIALAFFATITTTLAFTILFLRVLVVYVELAIAVIPYYLLGIAAPKHYLTRAKSFTNAPPTVPTRRRKRRGSGGSGVSGGSITPVASDVNFGLNQSIGPQRDFEGVGGWRLDVPSEDDSLWTSFHSRLELPADHGRRHRRSLTSGSMPLERIRKERSYSPEVIIPSANTSRARTPPTGVTPEGYFAIVPGNGGTKVLKKMPSNMTATSGSSISSKSSGDLSMKMRS